MKGHWLFGFQEGSTWDDVGSWAEKAIAADPQAAEIPELEAEQFAGVCYLLIFASPSMLHLLKKSLAVWLPSDRPHERRRATVSMLRKWRQPTLRDLLIALVPRTIMGRFVDPELNPDFWTLEHFREAFAEGMNICLLVQYKRFLDPAADIAQWLPTVSEFAPYAYAAWIQISRLTMRRVVYHTVPGTGADAQSAAALLEDVKAMSTEAGAATGPAGARDGARPLPPPPLKSTWRIRLCTTTSRWSAAVTLPPVRWPSTERSSWR